MPEPFHMALLGIGEGFAIPVLPGSIKIFYRTINSSQSFPGQISGKNKNINYLIFCCYWEAIIPLKIKNKMWGKVLVFTKKVFYIVTINPAPQGKEESIFLLLNCNPMVQVDISQLSRECNSWREQLRLYRDEFNHNEAQLRQVASQPLSKDQLRLVEHLHNQFHIQLINIHDLKQAIKIHDRKMNFELTAFNGLVNEESYTRHEKLSDEYKSLKNTLQDLRTEFEQFLNRTQ